MLPLPLITSPLPAKSTKIIPISSFLKKEENEDCVLSKRSQLQFPLAGVKNLCLNPRRLIELKFCEDQTSCSFSENRCGIKNIVQPLPLSRNDHIIPPFLFYIFCSHSTQLFQQPILEAGPSPPTL